MSALSHLECSKCAQHYDPDAPQQLCRCGAPLLARYDLRAAAATFTPKNLAGREPALWRYAELLPLRNLGDRVSLNETLTPLAPLRAFGGEIGLEHLLLKDEGALPTGSFKARGAAVGVSRAKELGIRRFAMPTNGNAGGAWSAYAARAGMQAYIVMPRSAPAINRLECAMTGAHLWLVEGLIGDAGRIVGKAVAQHGLFDASTLKEPYRIEGKKTLGFEIVEQLEWSVPDVLLYPTGGGVGLIGIHKALHELRAMGMLGEKMPRMVAVQAQGCAPIVQAFREGKRESVPWQNAHTVAFGITVPKALGDFLVLDALYQTGGTAIAVGDAAIVEMQQRLAAREGLLICPEGAATLAAARELRAQGWIAPEETVVAVNTGTGLKYLDVPYPQPDVLQPGDDLPIA
ncbi:MAG TPA: threonine synthase [Candidatus Baltobacteraceae bacterium]|nr:threonine synthase [Candidatus Baltobacteraceae bacterium]